MAKQNDILTIPTMPCKKLFAICLFMCFTYAGQAQFFADYRIIKLNPAAYAVGNRNMGMETIYGNISTGINIGFIRNHPLDHKPSRNFGIEDLKIQGVQIKVEQRVYLQPGDLEAPAGPYIGFAYKYGLLQYNYDFSLEDTNGGFMYPEQVGTTFFSSLGLMIGYQHILDEKYTFEIFGGPTLNSFNSDFQFYQSPREDFQAELSRYFLKDGIGMNIGFGIGLLL